MGGTDHVWFYDMTADGFSLDDKRTPIAENDPDIIERFKNLDKETERKRTDKSKVAVQKALEQTQLLFDSLMQKYFG